MVLCEATSGRELRRLPHQVAALTVAFAPDGKTLAAGLADGSIVLWDPDTGSQRESVAGHSSQVTSLAYSPDGRTLMAAGRDCCPQIDLWGNSSHLRSSLIVRSTPMTHQVWFATVSPDGKTLATGSGDRTVRLWDMATKQLRASLNDHTAGVSLGPVTPASTRRPSSGE